MLNRLSDHVGVISGVGSPVEECLYEIELRFVVGGGKERKSSEAIEDVEDATTCAYVGTCAATVAEGLIDNFGRVSAPVVVRESLFNPGEGKGEDDVGGVGNPYPPEFEAEIDSGVRDKGRKRRFARGFCCGCCWGACGSSCSCSSSSSSTRVCKRSLGAFDGLNESRLFMFILPYPGPGGNDGFVGNSPKLPSESNSGISTFWCSRDLPSRAHNARRRRESLSPVS